MNAQELTRLRQKQAVRYIGRPQPTDASLQTWKVQARGSSVQIPVSVPNTNPNAGTGVMSFVNTKDWNSNTCPSGVNTVSKGNGTNGEYLNVLMKAASCAVCADPNPAINPGGVTLPCCTYEPRQRYYITNSEGVIVDMNTYITTLNAGPQCVGCEGEQFNDNGRPINAANCVTNIYGGGGIAATTVNTTGMRLKFASS